MTTQKQQGGGFADHRSAISSRLRLDIAEAAAARIAGSGNDGARLVGFAGTARGTTPATPQPCQ